MRPPFQQLASSPRRAPVVVALVSASPSPLKQERPLPLQPRSPTSTTGRRRTSIAIATASVAASTSVVRGSAIMASASAVIAATSSSPFPSAPAPAAATVKDKTPFIIVGSGRVGEALAAMGENDLLVRRNDPIPAADDAKYPLGTPIVVCTRNDALDAVLSATPRQRRKDLVFIQNGMIQPWLDAKGIGAGDDAATQVLVFFAVSARGERPVDGVTDTDPQGLTCAHGRHAEAFASRLRGCGGLSCRVIASREEFDAAALEKLVWISAFMLVGSRHGGVTVGEVESEHAAEVSRLIAELARGGARALGLKEASADENGVGVVERLKAYARSVAHFPTAVKEFEWRNGWFWDLTKKSEGEGREDPFPMHSRLLKEVGAV